MNQDNLQERPTQILQRIIARHVATIKRIDEENIWAEQRSLIVKIKLNPNTVRSSSNSF